MIATLTASCPERDVLIASVDHDYYQLLRDAGMTGSPLPDGRLPTPAVAARQGQARYPSVRSRLPLLGAPQNLWWPE